MTVSACLGLLVLLAITQNGWAQNYDNNRNYDNNNRNYDNNNRNYDSNNRNYDNNYHKTSVRCWTCSTDTYGDICGDPFNFTKYQEFNTNYQNVNNNGYRNQNQYNRNDIPRLEACTAGFGQQAMCKKTVMTMPNNRRIISRECSPMSTRQAIGKCPTEATGRDIYIEFCEYCNEDGCNSASGLTTNVLLAAIIPCALLYYFRK